IILYLLYPYLLKKINAQPLITSIVVLMLFLSVCYFNVFYIRDFNNLFSCLISFFVGMLIFKYNKILKSKLVFLLSLFSVTIMFIIKIPINENLAIHIMGLLFFIVLYWIGILLTKPRILKFIFEKIGKISYQIFLLQHIIIYRMLLIHNPEDKIGSYKYLSLVIFVTLLAATGLFLLTKFVLNTKTYIETENRYLKTDIIKDDTKEQIKNMDN
ncbi:MAG: hypothetical protein IJ167_06175, partial [Lachnospiraceae bacterium]|nr:hypothetical protein [Lachnospiraceae bacterium]